MTKEEVASAFAYWGESIFNPTGKENEKATIMRSIYAYIYDRQLWDTLPEDAMVADDYLWNAYLTEEIVLEDGIVVGWLLTKEESSMGKRSYDKFAGTWALNEKASREFRLELEKLQDHYFGIIGSDELYDYIDGAIRTLTDLEKESRKEGEV